MSHAYAQIPLLRPGVQQGFEKNSCRLGLRPGFEQKKVTDEVVDQVVQSNGIWPLWDWIHNVTLSSQIVITTVLRASGRIRPLCTKPNPNLLAEISFVVSNVRRPLQITE